jgi:L-asparaginase
MINKSKVLIIYTGGTIGMVIDPKSERLFSFDFKHIFHHVPELERLGIDLECISFENPIDSSEMNPSHWAEIAHIIYDNYAFYDGFVILHGTDTMAYTASGLSFMLQGLQKSIILTGSQLPIGTLRTDGKENLITAIQIASSKNDFGESIVKEVAIYFESSLLRGNRSSKISANQFKAFNSPNYAKLASVGVNIEYNKERLFRSELSKLNIFTQFDNNVALLKIFPGFSATLHASIFDVNMVKGIIIETFGSGNSPSDASFIELISNYISTGGIILNITQCSSGSVDQGKYETSSFFSKIGVVSGRDMTTEAAITKMMYLLGSEISPEAIKEKLSLSLIGELTI